MLLTALATLVLAAVPAGTELHYTGTISQQVATGGSAAKTFTITALVANGEDGPELLYQVEERGAGGWPWPERFGRLSLAKSDGPAVRLLHTFDGNYYPLPVRRPLFEFTERLQTDATWNIGNHQYSCLRTNSLRGRECWIVEASLDRARRQRMHIEQQTGLLVALEERLFLGRGDPFEMKLQLESVRQLSSDESARNTAAGNALIDLQKSLNRPENAHNAELNAEQVTLVAAAVPELKQAAMDTGWQRLVETIDRDLQQQRRRLEGVNGLAQKFVGQPASLPDLKLLSGDTLKSADLAGRVVVLHFWEYPGDKLVEPYGQVGYLDFLAHRREKLGATVLGVAVDARLRDPMQRGGALRSIRKLQEFMNLSYPIAIDDGTLLTQFGDPRSLGAPLPLWIVIGSDGKIAHYQAGQYDIKPDEGLKTLDAAVVEALKQRARQ